MKLSSIKLKGSEQETVDFHDTHTCLNRWGGECFLKINSMPGMGTMSMQNGKLKQSNSDIDIELYDLEPTAQFEEGGVELAITLKTKPFDNNIVVPIEMSGLEFFYQHPLSNVNPDGSTWEFNEIGGKRTRPANVNGSYAVYHSSKSDHVSGGTNYKCGKAFHIYRPKAIDSLGKEQWCDIKIDSGELTITIDQTFIDTSTYPIFLKYPEALTFGYTGEGGSEDDTRDAYVQVSKAATTPASNGTLDSISLYCYKDTAGAVTMNPAIYSDSSGPDAKLASSYTGGSTVGGAYGWVTTTLGYGSITASTQYWIGFHCDGSDDYNMHIGYDAGSAGDLEYKLDTQWSDPFGAPTGTAASKYSIYATYTAAGGAKVGNPLLLLGAGA